MNIQVCEKLYNLANSCSFPLYVVGGYVRDSIAGLQTAQKDIDICAPTDAQTLCEEAQKHGAVIHSVYRNTGTVKLSFGEDSFEFACFRSDEYVRGTHTPVRTFFTDDISLDARRRDFKCNAVYYNIKEGTLCDPLGGIADIKGRILSTVADADKVFGEDGLRLMRLARQAAQLGFTPTEDCIDGARHNCRLVADITPERIYTELTAILHADARYGRAGAQYDGLKVLDSIGVLDVILPELTLGRGMGQNEIFHRHDVLEHSLRSVLYADSDIRLAALLHDIGKPYCMRTNGDYHGHEVEGARIAQDVCTRLKVPTKLTAETVRLCALHMYDFKCDAHENKIRRIIINNGDIFDKLLHIKQADYSACRDDLSQAPCVTKWKNIYNKMVQEGAPLNLQQLKIKGDKLIELGVPPQQVGTLLKTLLEDCAFNPHLNNAKTLAGRVKKQFSRE